jgi:hypothetical protein
MFPHPLRRMGSLAAATGALTLTCGGKTEGDYTLPDGGTIHFKRGALCAQLDLKTYGMRYVEAPTCDQDGVPSNPTCLAWAKTLGLPLIPRTLCLNHTCAIESTWFAQEEGQATCSYPAGGNPPQDSVDYCAGLFGELVLGDGDVQATCRNGSPPSYDPKCTLGRACTGCDLWDMSTTPPSPRVCVVRKGVARCETWCQSAM